MKNITQPVSSSAGMILVMDGLADLGTGAKIKGAASVIVGLVFIFFIKDKKDSLNEKAENNASN